jgi:hypothetical protein
MTGEFSQKHQILLMKFVVNHVNSETTDEWVGTDEVTASAENENDQQG